MRTILSLLFMLVMLSFAGAQPQTFEDYINSLPPATIPLGSGDQLYVRQLGVSKQVPGNAFASVSSAPGMVGDGTTNNTAVFQALLTTAGANGGSISLPCGTFVIGGATTLTVAAGKSATVAGQGLCTTLAYQGTNATAVAIGDVFSSIHWAHMRVTTNAAGTFTGLTAAAPNRGAPNLAPLFSVHHIFEDLHFTGDDYATAAARYWSADLSITNLTNVQIDNVTSLGALGGSSGTGVRLQGDATFMNPSVVINFKNYLSAYHNIGIDWENNVEGITVSSSNFQSNNFGIRANPTSADLSELAVVNSQFGSNATAGILLSANVGQFALSNSLFELTGGAQIGVAGTGVDFKIVGNSFGAPTSGPATGTAIFLQTVNGYGTVSANSFSRLGAAIVANSASTYVDAVISNNVYVALTKLFDITGGTNITITEAQPVNINQLPMCISAIQGSTMTVDNNASAASYRGAVTDTGSGTLWGRVFCPPTGAWVQN